MSPIVKRSSHPRLVAEPDCRPVVKVAGQGGGGEKDEGFGELFGGAEDVADYPADASLGPCANGCGCNG